MSVLSPSASAIIAQLGLQPLPREGGWFARTWTSRETLPNGARPAGTAIYFLLTPEDFSALHRLDAARRRHSTRRKHRRRRNAPTLRPCGPLAGRSPRVRSTPRVGTHELHDEPRLGRNRFRTRLTRRPRRTLSRQFASNFSSHPHFLKTAGSGHFPTARSMKRFVGV
jgi:hypothetical protein